MTTGSAVSLKQREATTVAYVSRKGPYSLLGAAIGALFEGLAQRGLAPAGAPGGTYYNAPGQVPDAELLWEIWVAVAGSPPEAPAEGEGVGIKRLAAAEVASTMHRGAYDQIGNTHGVLMQWITQNGYQVVGPAEEVYHMDPVNTPPERLLTEVCLPVRKRG